MKPLYIFALCIYALNLVLAFVGEINIPSAAGWFCCILLLITINKLENE